MKIRKIILAGNYQYEFYAPAWKVGLEKLGIDVVPFDWNKLWPDGVIGYVEKRLLLGPVLKKINNELLNLTEKVKPDVVMIYAGLPIYPKTIRRISQKYWISGYCNDDPFGIYAKKVFYRWLKKSIPLYNSHHVYREKNLNEYKQKGVKNVALLMPYYCPWLNQPVIEQDAPKYSVVFIGNAESIRSDFISYLIKQGVAVKVFGPPNYWKRYLPKDIYRKLSPIKLIFGREYARVLSNSKICLAFLNPGNNDQYTRRVFEIPACNGFLLCQRTPLMQELYVEGQEAEFFTTKEELLEKIVYYLSHEEQRRVIAQAGYQRCISSGYDIYPRMQQWLRDIEKWMEVVG